MNHLEMESEMPIFKAYLRKLKKELEEIKKLLEKNDTEKSLEEIERLLKDTEDDLQD